MQHFYLMQHRTSPHVVFGVGGSLCTGCGDPASPSPVPGAAWRGARAPGATVGGLWGCQGGVTGLSSCIPLAGQRRKSVIECCCGNGRGNPVYGSQRLSANPPTEVGQPRGDTRPPATPASPRGLPPPSFAGCLCPPPVGSCIPWDPVVLAAAAGMGTGCSALFWRGCTAPPALPCPLPQPCLGNTLTCFQCICVTWGCWDLLRADVSGAAEGVLGCR